MAEPSEKLDAKEEFQFSIRKFGATFLTIPTKNLPTPLYIRIAPNQKT